MSGAENASKCNPTAPIVAKVAPPEIVFNPVNPHLSIVEETAEEPYRLRSPSESSSLVASAGRAKGLGYPLRSISPIEDIPGFINGKRNIPPSLSPRNRVPSDVRELSAAHARELYPSMTDSPGVGESRPVTRNFGTAAGVILNPPLGPTRRVGRKTDPPPIAILHDPTLATDIGPFTFEKAVFLNDPAPNARHFLVLILTWAVNRCSPTSSR